MIVQSWRPKRRNVKYAEKPDWLPEQIYLEAKAAKRFYNEEWEFWVHIESIKANKNIAETEDACIRGLKKALDRIQFIWGPKVAKWYIEYLDMGDIFSKVKHAEIINPKLGEE